MIDYSAVPPGRLIAKTHSHIYIAPHPLLGGAVAHYTITLPAQGGAAPAGAPTLTILPDVSGCLIFSPDGAEPALIWGATTRAVQVQGNTQSTPVRLFVEFKPAGGRQLTGLEMAELADSRQLLADVLPGLERQMNDALQGAATLGELLQRADGVLIKQLLRMPTPSIAAIMPLLSSGLVAGMRRLANQTGYSERHLSRLFRSELGVGVKACARVIRVNQAIQAMRPGVSLTGVAHGAGYYDQSHFNHDFLAVCGVTPGAYLAAMADFYKEEYKF